jgi:hypothetical protein
MAKKKISGSSKLSKPVTSEPMNLINRSSQLYATSYRFTIEDKEKLNDITKEVNKLSSKTISNTYVLQALIHLGGSISSKKIFQAYKDIM